jgi:trans-aconitate 2-methyltransferase
VAEDQAPSDPESQRPGGWDGTAYDAVNGLQLWVAERSLAGLRLSGGERVLDVGCGDGRITAEIAARLPRGSVLGIDPSPRMLDVARTRITPLTPNLSFSAGSVEGLEQVDEFDLVVSFNALHWVADHESALTRIRRVLRATGSALVQLVCEGPRASVEDVASSVASRPEYAGWLASGATPYHHPVEGEFLQSSRTAGFEVLSSRVDDLAWDFGSADRFREWLRVGFSAWLEPLPDDDVRSAFLDDVTAAYTELVGSSSVVRFLQLRVELAAS